MAGRKLQIQNKSDRVALKLVGSLTSLCLIFLFGIAAYASQNSGITYHGRILKPDGTPLEGANVLFRLQIRTPGNENCLLYEEFQSKDMRHSNGVFSLTIGDGSGTRGVDSGHSLERIFQNRGSFTGLPDCLGSANYNPNDSDGRRFVVMFRDETMSKWEPLPAMTINFVPMAFEARSVGGFNASHLLRVVDGGEPRDVSPLSLADLNELRDLLDGTSNQYMPRSSSSGAMLPSFPGGSGPAAPQPGSVWFDSDEGAIKFYNGTTVLTLGTGSGSGTVMSITAGAGLTGGTITTSGTIALEDVGTPGTFYQVTTDQKGRVVSGKTNLDASDIPALDWSKITTGKPSTLDGYGISDAVKNEGGVTSIQTGTDASKPSAGTPGRIYVAWDTQKVYLDNGSSGPWWHPLMRVAAER